jgi:hypothetical protein
MATGTASNSTYQTLDAASTPRKARPSRKPGLSPGNRIDAKDPGRAGTQSKNAKARDWIPWILLFLCAGERLAFLVGSQDRSWPFSIFYEGDAETFYNFARAILAGQPYDGGIPFHPPLFPMVLAMFHGLLSDPVPNELLRGILGVLSAAAPVLLYRFGRDLVGRGPAAVAGFLAALSFGLDAIGTSATSEGLYLFLLLVALDVARNPIPPRDGWRGLARPGAIGAIGGLMALTRAEGVLGILLIGAIRIGADTIGSGDSGQDPSGRMDGPTARKRIAIRHGAAILAGLLVIILPWTIRNAVTLSRWNNGPGRAIATRLPTLVPITAYGPLNFALANNDSATGGFRRAILTSQASKGVLDLKDPQHRHYFLHGTAEGLRWITGHPVRFIGLVGKKLDITSRAFDLGWTPWNIPLGRTGLRRPVDIFSPGYTGLRWLQLGLAAIGIWLLLRERRATAVLLPAAPATAGIAAAILFFGYVRLGVLMLPFFFLFEGVALVWIAGRLPAKIRGVFRDPWVSRGLLLAAAAIAIAAAAQDRDYHVSGTTDRVGGMLDRDSDMSITPISK